MVWLTLSQGLFSLLGLVNFALGLVVLIKLYRIKGASALVFALFCSPYLFIWGWQNAQSYGFTKAMNAWKLCLLAQILVMGLCAYAASVAMRSGAFPIPQ